MARKRQRPQIDYTIVHPDPDTSPNASKRGKPPPTWDPGKVTRTDAPPPTRRKRKSS